MQGLTKGFELKGSRPCDGKDADSFDPWWLFDGYLPVLRPGTGFTSAAERTARGVRRNRHQAPATTCTPKKWSSGALAPTRPPNAPGPPANHPSADSDRYAGCCVPNRLTSLS